MCERVFKDFAFRDRNRKRRNREAPKTSFANESFLRSSSLEHRSLNSLSLVEKKPMQRCRIFPKALTVRIHQIVCGGSRWTPDL